MVVKLFSIGENVETSSCFFSRKDFFFIALKAYCCGLHVKFMVGNLILHVNL